MKVDFSKQISIDNVFNEYNLHKIKLIASIENYKKVEKENKKEFVAIDNRNKHLILEIQNKYYDLHENVTIKDVLPNKADQYKIVTININCYEINKESFLSLVNSYENDKNTFYFVPEHEISLCFVDKKETTAESNINLKVMKIEVNEKMLLDYRTSFIMPFTMININIDKIKNLVNIQTLNEQIKNKDIER